MMNFEEDKIITKANDILFKDYKELYIRYIGRMKEAEKESVRLSVCICIFAPTILLYLKLQDFCVSILFGALLSLGCIIFCGALNQFIVYPFLIRTIIKPQRPEFVGSDFDWNRISEIMEKENGI